MHTKDSFYILGGPELVISQILKKIGEPEEISTKIIKCCKKKKIKSENLEKKKEIFLHPFLTIVFQ